MDVIDDRPLVLVTLLLVAAGHLGFQLTVSLVVYPALAEVGDEAWPVAHERHARRIAPLVGALYVPLVLVLGWDEVAAREQAGCSELQAFQYAFLEQVVLVPGVRDEKPASHQDDVLQLLLQELVVLYQPIGHNPSHDVV